MMADTINGRKHIVLALGRICKESRSTSTRHFSHRQLSSRREKIRLKLWQLRPTAKGRMHLTPVCSNPIVEEEGATYTQDP